MNDERTAAEIDAICAHNAEVLSRPPVWVRPDHLTIQMVADGIREDREDRAAAIVEAADSWNR